jgi:hypothetical protein
VKGISGCVTRRKCISTHNPKKLADTLHAGAALQVM